jgi:hypothetical protein
MQKHNRVLINQSKEAMETFVNFRMGLYARDSHRVCRLHADLPKGDGLQYVSFVMYERELEQFASPVCALSDGCLRLDVWGDLCHFYDLQIPSEKRHGLAQIRYCTATVPLFVTRAHVSCVDGFLVFDRVDCVTRRGSLSPGSIGSGNIPPWPADQREFWPEPVFEAMRQEVSTESTHARCSGTSDPFVESRKCGA